MTTDQKFSLLIATLGLIFTVMTIGLGVFVKALVKFTKAEDKLSDLAEDVERLVQDKDKVHQVIFEQLKDDRKATDQRLRWLEENVWSKLPRSGLWYNRYRPKGGNMPYEIREEDGKHCVYNKDTGDKKACHDTKEEAERQVRLLHAVENDPGWEPTNG